MSCHEPGNGLPKQFVSSLKILFSILDENNSGFVRFKDIESRWSGEGVNGLPTGILEALRLVTPHDGLLDFDTFVSGLKAVLLKEPLRRQDTNRQDKENRGPLNRQDVYPRHPSETRGGPVREPPLDKHVQRSSRQQMPVTATVKPNNAVNTNYRRAYSTPHLNEHTLNSHGPAAKDADDVRPPPRPQRSHQSVPPSTAWGNAWENRRMNRKSISGPELSSISHQPATGPPQVPPRDFSKSGRVLNELKKTLPRERFVSSQIQSSGSQTGNKPETRQSKSSKPSSVPPIYANVEDLGPRRTEERQKEGQRKAVPPQKPVRRQGSARRHTVGGGVDHNMLKRLRLLEEEREVLSRGMEVLEQARDWYRHQLSVLQDKLKLLGKAPLNDYSVEAQQERMNFQKARISEVNQHLRTLIESSEKGFPLHMNLALTKPSYDPRDNTISRLKDQNRQLTAEVGQKSERITQLEQEKNTLIRELFEARSKHKTNYDDTTFM